MNQPHSVRRATPADAASIVRLNIHFNGSSMPADQLAEQMGRCAEVETLFLAEVAGEAVGYACLRIVPTICSPQLWAEITELFVEPAYQKQGIGKALIEQAEKEAITRGAVELFLMTGFKNTNAHHFYHRVGYSMQCFTMKKDLPIATHTTSYVPDETRSENG